MKVGDEIKYNIAALPSSQYGVITGTVRSISQDVLTQNGECQVCCRVNPLIRRVAQESLSVDKMVLRPALLNDMNQFVLRNRW